MLNSVPYHIYSTKFFKCCTFTRDTKSICAHFPLFVWIFKLARPMSRSSQWPSLKQGLVTYQPLLPHGLVFPRRKPGQAESEGIHLFWAVHWSWLIPSDQSSGAHLYWNVSEAHSTLFYSTSLYLSHVLPSFLFLHVWRPQTHRWPCIY